MPEHRKRTTTYDGWVKNEKKKKNRIWIPTKILRVIFEQKVFVSNIKKRWLIQSFDQFYYGSVYRCFAKKKKEKK